jgi:hypothetical protein
MSSFHYYFLNFLAIFFLAVLHLHLEQSPRSTAATVILFCFIFFLPRGGYEQLGNHACMRFCCRDLRFMCCFRFKLWWMTQRMGTSGRDVPLETQFMLLESRPGAGDGDDSGEPVYLVMLPLLEGQFRAALQGNDRDELEITLESGKHPAPGHAKAVVVLFSFPAAVFHVIASRSLLTGGARSPAPAMIFLLLRVPASRGQGGADGAGDVHGVRARRDQPLRHHHSGCQVRFCSSSLSCLQNCVSHELRQ